jgi:hypothetical protein
MPAVNVVRFRVKPGRENDFVEAHKTMKDSVTGMRRGWLVKTGDRSYCVVGVWKEHADLVAARPGMIANLDKVRGMLEDLGGGLGVTDPVSGEVALDLTEKEGKGRKKARKAGRGAAGGASGDARSARRAQRSQRGSATGTAVAAGAAGVDRSAQKAQRSEARRARKAEGGASDKAARKAQRAEQKKTKTAKA